MGDAVGSIWLLFYSEGCEQCATCSDVGRERAVLVRQWFATCVGDTTSVLVRMVDRGWSGAHVQMGSSPVCGGAGAGL